jgi:hypothetical protein
MYPVSNADSAARLHLQQRRGDTFNLSVFFEQNDAPEDFTGSSFKMRVICKGDPYKKAVLDFTDGEFQRPEPGVIETTKSAAVMAAIPAGYYSYDLQQLRPDGQVRTRLSGDFIITNDVTPAP